MIRRHLVQAGLTALFLMSLVIIVLMWLAGSYSQALMSAMMVLIILGMAVGTLIPNILITWLIIGLSVFGSIILLFGYVVIDSWLKILLLLAFPLTAAIAALNRFIIGQWGWIDRNRSDIESYAEHYNQTVKLQTSYNARKLYQKSINFVTSEQGHHFWLNVTAIQWAHGQQFAQFHPHEYKHNLRQIAKVLKKNALPSTFLFYLGDSTFLLISYRVPAKLEEQLIRQLMDKLAAMPNDLQFKLGAYRIDSQNAHDFAKLDDVMRPIKRQMETDIIVEYLKGGQEND